MITSDRIDLKAIGTWAKNFRPNGLALSFGDDLDGGVKFAKLKGVTLPYGSYVGTTVLSAASLAGGTVTTSGVAFSGEIFDVHIPFGTKFNVPLNIGGTAFPTGVFGVPAANQFLMETTQLIDVTNKAVFSVHGIETEEVVAFNRPTADILRLVMYRNGVGIDCPAFACYSIVFKTNLTLAQIQAFALLHPSDVNPIVIDDGSVINSNFIIPQ